MQSDMRGMKITMKFWTTSRLHFFVSSGILFLVSADKSLVPALDAVPMIDLRGIPATFVILLLLDFGFAVNQMCRDDAK